VPRPLPKKTHIAVGKFDRDQSAVVPQQRSQA
jgi:hypothetical protein